MKRLPFSVSLQIQSIPIAMNNVTKYIVCEKHWQTGYQSIQQKKKRPANPPSIIIRIPKSYNPQTLIYPSQNFQKQQIDCD